MESGNLRTHRLRSSCRDTETHAIDHVHKLWCIWTVAPEAASLSRLCNKVGCDATTFENRYASFLDTCTCKCCQSDFKDFHSYLSKCFHTIWTYFHLFLISSKSASSAPFSVPLIICFLNLTRMRTTRPVHPLSSVA